MTKLVCIPVTKLSELTRMAPKTAIATAPPTWRNVLKTALAVPARSAGTLSRTTPVMAGMATAPPGPMKTSRIAVSTGDPSGAVISRATSPTTIDSRPATTGTRGPNRFLIPPLSTLPAMLNTAAGRKASPA